MIRVYNTLTKTHEEFVPTTEKLINWYNCGPTVYDRLHIGHARSAIAFDTIRRYFEFQGYEVRFVMNFTDIDDKMINRALKEQKSVIEVAEEHIYHYYEDMDRLNVKRATLHPRATVHIPHMIEFIEKLIQKGFAYEKNGDVYFDIRKAKEYGKLSKQKLENILERTDDTDNPNKFFSADFALWKAKKEGEPSWLSPWGYGRPGWHIECSAMSMTYLGETLDIHSGGQDLIFPHHENEIAQSESLTNKTFAKYWLHNGFVQIDSEKMSKSLGNFVTLNNLLQMYSPDAIRLYVLLTHYRQPIDFTEEGLQQAKITSERLFDTILLTRIYKNHDKSPLNELDTSIIRKIDEATQIFIDSMNDDFNTSNGLAIVFSLSKEVNDYVRKSEVVNGSVMEHAHLFFSNVRQVLGLFEDMQQYSSLETIERLVQLLIELRQDYRTSKNWAQSDKIRDTLKEAGITLEDNPKRILWKIT